jgi:hypothetical protein
MQSHIVLSDSPVVAGGHGTTVGFALDRELTLERHDAQEPKVNPLAIASPQVSADENGAEGNASWPTVSLIGRWGSAV